MSFPWESFITVGAGVIVGIGGAGVTGCRSGHYGEIPRPVSGGRGLERVVGPAAGAGRPARGWRGNAVAASCGTVSP